jgi:hypothetical protein
MLITHCDALLTIVVYQRVPTRSQGKKWYSALIVRGM